MALAMPGPREVMTTPGVPVSSPVIAAMILAGASERVSTKSIP
jgi:hypothetical protein